MDESSLSEREQKILEEIERNLNAEDPSISRRMRDVNVTRAKSVLRLSIAGLVLGLVLLVGFYLRFEFGVAGFALMLLSLIGIATSIRKLSAGRLAGGKVLAGAWRKAEDKMRTRRKDG